MLETKDVNCPYCGESFNTAIDSSAGDQSYIEDCYVCCRPIEFELTVTEFAGHATVRLKTDDE